MADENTLNQSVDVNEEDEGQVTTKVEKPYGTLELVTFGDRSKMKGFQFWQRQYKTTQDAINHVNSLGKNGEEIIVGLINNAISFATRTKAANGAPQGETKQQTLDLLKGALERNEILLITEEEAEKYVPGTRERYGLGYFQRQYWEARKKFAADKSPENRAAFLKAKEELDKAQMEDLENTLAEAEAPAQG